jgi:hypothetical protein
MQNSPGRRAAAYWFVDGFPEIVLGALLVVCGIAGILCDTYVPLTEENRQFLGLAIMLAGFVVYYLKERAILGWLKSRVTYPRTGYVQPPEEMDRGCRRGLITLSLRSTAAPNENVSFFRERIAMLIFSVFVLWPYSRSRPVLPFLIATLALALFVVSRRLQHRYRWWSTLILALLGVPFLWIRIPPILGPMVGLVLAGSWVLVEGFLTLVAYLHANPLPRVTDGVEA